MDGRRREGMPRMQAGIVYSHIAPAPATASSADLMRNVTGLAPAAPATTPVDQAKIDSLAAQLKSLSLALNQAEMRAHMDRVSGFDAKNAIFHEYFDRIPEGDTDVRKGYFLTFMGGIDTADAERVGRFLEGLAKQ